MGCRVLGFGFSEKASSFRADANSALSVAHGCAAEEEEEEEEEEEADEAEVKKKPAQQTKTPAGKGKPLPVHKKPAGHPPAKKQKQQSDAENVNYAMELARRELDDDLPPSQLLDFGDLRDDGSRPTEAAPQR